MRRVTAVVAVAVLAALAAVGAALWLGNRLSEPTVVPDPYEAGLRHDELRAREGGRPTSAGVSPGGGRAAAAPSSAQVDHAHDAASVGPRAPPSCDLGRGPCAQRVDGTLVTLELAPRPLHAMQELVLTAQAAPTDAVGSGAARVSFSMPGMPMGDNRAALEPAGAGRWRGKGLIVRCPSGGRRWAAEVELPRATGEVPLRATFFLEVVE